MLTIPICSFEAQTDSTLLIGEVSQRFAIPFTLVHPRSDLTRNSSSVLNGVLSRLVRLPRALLSCNRYSSRLFFHQSYRLRLVSLSSSLDSAVFPIISPLGCSSSQFILWLLKGKPHARRHLRSDYLPAQFVSRRYLPADFKYRIEDESGLLPGKA